MHSNAYWIKFPRFFWENPNRLLGFNIIIFWILLSIPLMSMSQESKTTPTPTVTPTPDVLLEIKPISPVTEESKQDDDIIKVEINLVSLAVSTTDSYDRLVPGLKKENFEVYEYDGKKKVKQEIAFFTYDDTPIIAGIVLDISGSMSGEKMDYAGQAVGTFLKTSNKNDDIFVLGFDEKSWLIQESAINDDSTVNNVLNKLALIRPNDKKSTALYDAVHIAIHKIQELNKQRSQQGKRILKMALFIISDGQDNYSRYTFKKVREELIETNVMIYSIVIPPSVGSDMDIDALQGKDNLVELSELTGGKAYLPDFPRSIRFPDYSVIERPPLTVDEAVTRIALELRRQYTIAYYPTNQERDGKYRKIYIKVIPPKGLPRLTVRAKPGYYAPKS